MSDNIVLLPILCSHFEQSSGTEKKLSKKRSLQNTVLSVLYPQTIHRHNEICVNTQKSLRKVKKRLMGVMSEFIDG